MMLLDIEDSVVVVRRISGLEGIGDELPCAIVGEVHRERTKAECPAIRGRRAKDREGNRDLIAVARTRESCGCCLNRRAVEERFIQRARETTAVCCPGQVHRVVVIAIHPT